MRLIFSKIHNNGIFNSEFDSLSAQDGAIEFKRQSRARGGIAVVYAPNGTGKTSFAETLKTTSSSDTLDFLATDDTGTQISPSSHAFHIVGDQISRHIIQGDESQYLVGADIRREYELKKRVGTGFSAAFSESLPRLYKNTYSVTRADALLLARVRVIDAYACDCITNIINSRSRGRDIERATFVAYISNPRNRPEVIRLDDNITEFIVRDCSGQSRIVKKLLDIDPTTMILHEEAPNIEQHDDAIGILRKYDTLLSCIVCDNPDYDANGLLARKQDNRTRIYNSLDPRTKDLLDKVAMDPSLIDNDPFGIKRIVMAFISGAEATELVELQTLLNTYVDSIAKSMILNLIDCFVGTSMLQDFNELLRLRENDPELDSDDLIYLENVISENIGRDIRVIREEVGERNFQLMLGDAPLLNVVREDMHLSTGEQNFISLAFELLLAKNSGEEYIVLDDPISSFDSVYKNKIVFCIVKFLEDKKQIILTHNLDLVRLLEFQLNGCFNLYMLNRAEGGRNGFIPVKAEEKKLLISLSDLVKFFQNQYGALATTITNKRQFLLSMIPFMRGYAHISKDHENRDYYGRLSEVMHGYGTASINLVAIYDYLFGYNLGGNEEVNAADILGVDCEQLSFFDEESFPLLADTLRQTLIYYHLRMTVEKKLMDVFGITAGPNVILQLNDIIQRAFRCDDVDDPEYERKRAFRVFFTSRKTLLNEFNHFEGNMNIFQPAIDITVSKLKDECASIKSKLAEIEARYITM